MLQIDLLSRIPPLKEKLDIELSKKDKSELDKMKQKLELSHMEKFASFNLNSRLFASQKIPLDLSNYIYQTLRDYENKDLSTKYILLQILEVLTKID